MAGIAEEADGLRAFFETPADSGLLLRRFARFKPQLRREEATDCAQVSRDAWPPMLVGQRFYLVAPWSESETPAGCLRLEIEPGMACGTGRHPATQLCLEAMERYVWPGSSVLDIGTGSGILAQAAGLLGARCAVGCDIDPEAIQVARRRSNLILFTGSVDAVRSRSADLIVANIDAASIELLAPELKRVRRPQSTMILAGFTAGDIPEGVHPRETLRREEWICLIC